MRQLLLLVFLHVLVHGSDLGFSVGSRAASQLVQHAVKTALHQPRRLQLEVRNSGRPWFEPIAHLDSKAKVSLNEVNVRFHNNWVDVNLSKLTINSTTNIVVLPLPFFLGEDTAHLVADVPHADVRFKLQNMNLAVEECNINDIDVDVRLERAYLMNLALKPLVGMFPNSIARDYVCTTLSDHLGALRNRFALEIPLISVVPLKFRQYLHQKNSTLRIHLTSIESDKEQLTLSAEVDWAETQINEETYLTTPATPTSSSEESAEVSERDPETVLKSLTVATQSDDVNQDKTLQLWAEDRLFNELMDKFDWDFEWMSEDISVNSDKLPRSTRDFLAVLCPTCYFELRVSANGTPHVQSANHTLVLQKSDRIFIKVVNPTTNTNSVFVSLYLTLTIQLIPEVGDGIFRTQVNLLSTDIRMEDGAFPSAWNEFVQDLVKGMIMDVIWPGLKKEIEALIYSDGLRIPSTCGLEPTSMKLHFDEGKFAVTSRLMLDDLSIKQCLQQVKSKLPDPAKLLVIKDI